ncbi:MAG: hypothetical protein JWR44_764 [Hymenobacter sp.]|jgi:hypothetical protein|nr:hypothetical protein [Hymenobacter sp.]
MKTLAFFWSVAALLLASCNDPTTGTTFVEGQVVDYAGSRPVGGATVRVNQRGAGGGFGAVGDPVLTDGQGRFSFHFEATSKSGYVLAATAPPGYFSGYQLAPTLIAGRKNTGLVVPMYAPAWLRLQFVDTLPKSRVVISIGYETLYYPRDTVLIRPIEANFKSALSWSINDQGKNTATSIYVTPGSLDTLTVRVPF